MAATAELRAALEGFEREADDGSTITLHQFELASLANLMQADSEPEEALALIPSLSKFTEQDIKAILDIVHKAHAPR
eukprot:19726-Heterococcus_DN1.PRE.1